MPDVLVVTDSGNLYRDVRSVIEQLGAVSRWVRSGHEVLGSLQERAADLVVTDIQVGSMGGFAIAMELLLEAGAGRLAPTPLLVLLDRRADVFLARRTGVAGWLVKPLDPLRTRDAVQAILSGGQYHDPTFAPLPATLGAV